MQSLPLSLLRLRLLFYFFSPVFSHFSFIQSPITLPFRLPCFSLQPLCSVPINSDHFSVSLTLLQFPETFSFSFVPYSYLVPLFSYFPVPVPCSSLQLFFRSFYLIPLFSYFFDPLILLQSPVTFPILLPCSSPQLLFRSSYLAPVPSYFSVPFTLLQSPVTFPFLLPSLTPEPAQNQPVIVSTN